MGSLRVWRTICRSSRLAVDLFRPEPVLCVWVSSCILCSEQHRAILPDVFSAFFTLPCYRLAFLALMLLPLPASVYDRWSVVRSATAGCAVKCKSTNMGSCEYPARILTIHNISLLSLIDILVFVESKNAKIRSFHSSLCCDLGWRDESKAHFSSSPRRKLGDELGVLLSVVISYSVFHSHIQYNSPACQPHTSLLDTRSRRLPIRWSLLPLLVFYRSELSYSFTRQLQINSTRGPEAYHNIHIVGRDYLDVPTHTEFSHVGIVPGDAGFLGDRSFSPPLYSDVTPFSSRFTLIGSQDPDLNFGKRRRVSAAVCSCMRDKLRDTKANRGGVTCVQRLYKGNHVNHNLTCRCGDAYVWDSGNRFDRHAAAPTSVFLICRQALTGEQSPDILQASEVIFVASTSLFAFPGTTHDLAAYNAAAKYGDWAGNEIGLPVRFAVPEKKRCKDFSHRKPARSQSGSTCAWRRDVSTSEIDSPGGRTWRRAAPAEAGLVFPAPRGVIVAPRHHCLTFMQICLWPGLPPQCALSGRRLSVYRLPRGSPLIHAPRRPTARSTNPTPHLLFQIASSSRYRPVIHKGPSTTAFTQHRRFQRANGCSSRFPRTRKLFCLPRRRRLNPGDHSLIRVRHIWCKIHCIGNTADYCFHNTLKLPQADTVPYPETPDAVLRPSEHGTIAKGRPLSPPPTAKPGKRARVATTAVLESRHPSNLSELHSQNGHRGVPTPEHRPQGNKLRESGRAKFLHSAALAYVFMGRPERRATLFIITSRAAHIISPLLNHLPIDCEIEPGPAAPSTLTRSPANVGGIDVHLRTSGDVLSGTHVTNESSRGGPSSSLYECRLSTREGRGRGRRSARLGNARQSSKVVEGRQWLAVTTTNLICIPTRICIPSEHDLVRNSPGLALRTLCPDGGSPAAAPLAAVHDHRHSPTATISSLAVQTILRSPPRTLEWKFDFSGLEFPTPRHQIIVFEENNLGVSVSMYSISAEEWVVPVHRGLGGLLPTQPCANKDFPGTETLHATKYILTASDSVVVGQTPHRHTPYIQTKMPRKKKAGGWKKNKRNPESFIRIQMFVIDVEKKGGLGEGGVEERGKDSKDGRISSCRDKQPGKVALLHLLVAAASAGSCASSGTGGVDCGGSRRGRKGERGEVRGAESSRRRSLRWGSEGVKRGSQVRDTTCHLRLARGMNPSAGVGDAVLPRGAHTCRPAGLSSGRETWNSSNTPLSQLRDENGKMSLTNTENCAILRKYFDQLLNCEEPNYKLEFPEIHENLETDPPPTVEEIEKAIKTLKNNKASGEYSIAAELIKWSQPKIIDKLQIIFEEIWKTEKIPEEWKVALIHHLHKKGCQGRKEKKTGSKWSEERKKIHSEKMKEC
ncbi:hypothetical protein PR048_009575 [Dryococelus australis]|uniref:Uncharacterized protein n=1 Tax=Dryococelus australis TaxID=614101 RepID=A0ABQ9I095_9NEOP|nr:hypothetical protein PR048_009575 [Dryococelus australis]